MPVIPVNLGDVEEFDNLPFGTYEGEIKKLTYREARQAGKFPQIMVTYTCLDDEYTGQPANQFLSLSPRALFRVKQFFAMFGMGDLPEFVVDDEDETTIVEPDLEQTRVRFEVAADGQYTRVALIDVLDDVDLEVTEEEEEEEPAPKTRTTTTKARPKRRQLR